MGARTGRIRLAAAQSNIQSTQKGGEVSWNTGACSHPAAA